MFSYAIKENGYQIGTARGKKKAIEYIMKMELYGDWGQDDSGNIVFVTHEPRVYSIEHIT